MAYTTINKGSSYFNTVLYTGNGATQSVTGVGFQPDFVWIKGRSFADHHTLNDAVRGVNKQLYSNLAFAEGTATDCLTAFNTDGFSVGSNVIVNQSAATLVAWNWLANNTSGSSNTDGSITSTVAANTTAGFSIVSYTGTGANATVGHGLGVAPSFIIFKTRNAGYNWIVWTKAFATPTSQYLRLNLTDAVASGNNPLNGTLPSSTVISLSSDNNVNESAKTYIAYCFAEVKGFSKFGSYTGNGSADGTFVYTGFKPAFIIYKQSSAAGESWIMQDGARDLFNVTNKRLLANANNAEADEPIDFLSNGFKCRTTGAFQNASGSTYIYMCFASNPFVSSTLIPTTAR